MLELKGLVFVLDWDDVGGLDHDEAFTDAAFDLGFVKEVQGPLINGAIAVTVDLDDARHVLGMQSRSLIAVVKAVSRKINKIAAESKKEVTA